MMMEERRLKILFLEDVEEDAELVSRALKSEGLKFDLFRVDTREDFFRSIRETAFDVILSDHSLPQFNSSEALKLCRRLGINAPFILVTGSVSEEFAIMRLRQGADDYILKSNLSRLSTAIHNSLTNKKLASDRLEAELALRNQNEELLKINQELDSFVYSVSHDLRAPLRSLLGLLNISKLDQRPRDPIYDQYFRMMEGSIKKLDDTLKEILEYSRNARNGVSLTTIDFSQVLQSCISKLEYMEGYDEIKIDFEGIEKHLVTDAYRMAVVLENLLSNAIKYRDASKKNNYLSIALRVKESDVEITFRDNGIGIDTDLVPRIFNMFFRGTEKSDGAGLGLYIVKESVEKLGGRIEVQSVKNIGSEFKITLPVLRNG